MNVLLDKKLNEIRDLFSGFSPPINLLKYSDENNIEKYSSVEKMSVDLVVLELDDNHKRQISSLEELRKFNPDLRAILYTSLNNRKYRSSYLSKGFNFFIFRESELSLLKTVIKRVHHRKTLAN